MGVFFEENAMVLYLVHKWIWDIVLELPPHEQLCPRMAQPVFSRSVFDDGSGSVYV